MFSGFFWSLGKVPIPSSLLFRAYSKVVCENGTYAMDLANALFTEARVRFQKTAAETGFHSEDPVVLQPVMKDVGVSCESAYADVQKWVENQGRFSRKTNLVGLMHCSVSVQDRSLRMAPEFLDRTLCEEYPALRDMGMFLMAMSLRHEHPRSPMSGCFGFVVYNYEVGSRHRDDFVHHASLQVGGLDTGRVHIYPQPNSDASFPVPGHCLMRYVSSRKEPVSVCHRPEVQISQPLSTFSLYHRVVCVGALEAIPFES